MGMSATQARYLSLVAQQSNLEYQGQQINQERSILSQQVSELYNSLLALEVPTPPSTSDYTKVQYTGKDGATNFTLGEIKPQGEKYVVERKIEAVGDGLKARFGSYKVDTINGRTAKGNLLANEDIQDGEKIIDNGEYEIVPGQTPSAGDTVSTYVGKITEEQFNSGNYFIQANNGEDEGELGGSTTGDFIPATEYDPNAVYYTITNFGENDTFDDKTQSLVQKDNDEKEPIYKNAGDKGQYYILEPNGKVRAAQATDFDENGCFKVGIDYIKQNDDGIEYTKVESEQGDLTIEGKTAYTWEDAATLHPELDWGTYETAIGNTYGEDSGINKNSFYIYFTGIGESLQVNFALQDDAKSQDNVAQVFRYDAAAKYTKSEYTDGCKLEFDSAGRIIALYVPNDDGDDYTKLDLEASTVTDELAYQDAYAKYEFAQYEYDKQQQEINIKTEKIQQQDRNLELRLQRLDTQRQQITTEIEALEKVLNDNIEKTYKTFSG